MVKRKTRSLVIMWVFSNRDTHSYVTYFHQCANKRFIGCRNKEFFCSMVSITGKWLKGLKYIKRIKNLHSPLLSSFFNGHLNL